MRVSAMHSRQRQRLSILLVVLVPWTWAWLNPSSPVAVARGPPAHRTAPQVLAAKKSKGKGKGKKAKTTASKLAGAPPTSSSAAATLPARDEVVPQQAAAVEPEPAVDQVELEDAEPARGKRRSDRPQVSGAIPSDVVEPKIEELDQVDSENLFDYLDVPDVVKSGQQKLHPETMLAYYLPETEGEIVDAVFPRPSAEVRSKWRLSWGPDTTHENLLAAMDAADNVGPAAVKDFLLANYDQLGLRLSLMLSGMKLHAQFKKDQAQMQRFADLRFSFVTAEEVQQLGLAQLMTETEQQMRPITQDLNLLKAIPGQAPSKVCAIWILLKAAVTAWQDKVEKAQGELDLLKANAGKSIPREGVEEFKIEQKELQLQDMRESMQSWQQISGIMGNDERFKSKLRPELRFLDAAFGMKGDAEVRNFAVKTFCEEQGWEFDQLREEVRRIRGAIERLPFDNYAGLSRAVMRISRILDDGKSDNVNVFRSAEAAGQTYFETYTLLDEPNKNEFIRFSDYVRQKKFGDQSWWNPAASYDWPLDKRPKDLDWYSYPDDNELKEGRWTRVVQDINDDSFGSDFQESIEIRAALDDARQQIAAQRAADTKAGRPEEVVRGYYAPDGAQQPGSMDALARLMEASLAEAGLDLDAIVETERTFSDITDDSTLN